jgi:hypothetical protein
MDPHSQINAAVRAAASSDWKQRAAAAEELSPWADRADIAPILRQLLLDDGDTMVTERTCQALLRRDDIDGIRLIAQAVTATWPPDIENNPRSADHIDHLHDAILGHWSPDGPSQNYLDACTALSADPDLTTRQGAQHLLKWAQPYTPRNDQNELP